MMLPAILIAMLAANNRNLTKRSHVSTGTGRSGRGGGDYQPIDWHWHHYHNSPANTSKTSTSKESARRLLIAQYTGWDETYFEFTNISEEGNRAYAKKWNHDYVRMNGVAFHTTGLFFGKGKPGDATYNKVAVLRKAIETDAYDVVLMMDSDAVIVNFDRDALSLMPESILLLAQRVIRSDVPHTHNINIGVTMWNLRHEKINQVLDEWTAKIIRRMRWNRLPEDQCELQNLIKNTPEEERKKMVYAMNNTEIGAGGFVMHLVRRDAKLWVTPEKESENRMNSLKRLVKGVCEKWKGSCDNL